MLTKKIIENYFTAEKSGSLVFICLGIAAILGGLFFMFYLKKSWSKGAAIPLLAIGLLHLVAGSVVHNRSDKDRISIVYAFDMDHSLLQTKEIPRIEKVNKNFVYYRYTWLSLVFAGLGLILFFFKKPDKQFWIALGAALVLEAGISMCTDYFAEKRALDYTNHLRAGPGKTAGKF